jgi:hypothetical protein
MDPLLNAVAVAVVAAGLAEVETACGFAVVPGQEARGSTLKPNITHLQNLHICRHRIFWHVHIAMKSAC